jgi:hypothetical protein
MASFPHLMVRFAATTGVAAMLSTVAPAVVAESAAIASEAAAKTAPSVIKRHAWRETRIAASRFDRQDRRVRPILGNLDCSGSWCGRQFVLMIGVGY